MSKKQKNETLPSTETPREEQFKFENLKKNVHFSVFQYLSPKDILNFAKVCRSWESLSKETWKLHTLQLFGGSRDVVVPRATLKISELYEIILNFGSTLKRLEIVGCELTNGPYVLNLNNSKYNLQHENLDYHEFLKNIEKTCQNLRSLKLKDFKINEEMSFLLHNLMVKNEKLVEFELGILKCDLYVKPVDNLISLKDLPKTVEKVKIDGAYAEDRKLREFLFENFDLKFLEINEKEYTALFTEEFFKSIVTCENLSTLKLRAYNHLLLSKPKDVRKETSAEELRKISFLVNLEKLELCRFEKGITDYVLTTIGLNCSKLQEITLESCHKITRNGINVLLNSLPDLQSLSLEKLSITGICNASVHSNLQKLTISNCPNIKKNELKNISVFKQLKELSLDCKDGEMTDEVIASISFSCRKLVKVHLDGCNGMKKGIGTLINSLPNLLSFGLHNVENIEFNLHPENNSNVQELDLYNCYVPFDQWQNIAVLKNLEKLSIAFDEDKVSDDALIKIVQNCKNLRELSLQCLEIDENTVCALFAAPTLQVICLESIYWNDDMRGTVLENHSVSNLEVVKSKDSDLEFYNAIKRSVPMMPKLKILEFDYQEQEF